MSVLSSLPVLRWVVPAVAATAVIGGGAAIGTITASASPDLPARSAAQLLVDVQTARLQGLSGTVVQRADLGLPSLPAIGGQGSSDLTSLISGKHTLRVWYSGPDQARVALLGTLGESDVIANKTDVWLWDSKTKTAIHNTQPVGSDKADKSKGPLAAAKALTPQQAADAALAVIDPSTVVSTAGSAKVAGRNAYELVLAPRDKASRVDQVRLAIDAVQHVPLRVQVYAKGTADPAIEVAFSQVSFARPSADQFKFNPPPGTKVTENSGTSQAPSADKATTPGQSTIVGDGWTSVFVTRGSQNLLPGLVGGASSGSDTSREGNQASAILDRLPQVSGSWGSGRVLSSKLFSVLLTDDGRVLVGLVAPDKLYQVAADPAAALKTK
jgi:outer membrane lipoprotein-sorting protein